MIIRQEWTKQLVEMLKDIQFKDTYGKVETINCIVWDQRPPIRDDEPEIRKSRDSRGNDNR